MPEYRLDPTILEPLKGLPLFYPASGEDLMAPISLVSPWVSDFWR